MSGSSQATLRDLFEHVTAIAPRYDVRILAPEKEAKALRELDVPIETWKPAGLFNVLRSIGSLRRTAGREQPALIHCYGFTAAAVALGALPEKWTRRTIVSALEPVRGNEIPKAFVEKRLPDLLQRAATVVCGYASIAQTVTQVYGVAEERVRIIAHGVDQLFAEPVSRAPGRPGPIVGFTGRLDVGHAWETPIDALAEVLKTLPEARLWIAGEGPLRTLVRAHAKSRKVLDSVTFFGDVPMRELFVGIDMLLVPVTRDVLPYGLLEALVAGVPVVAANRGALADVVAPFETGWLVAPDPKGFAAGVADAWSRIDEAWEGAVAQREAAIAEFSHDAVRERMDALYRETIAAGAVAPTDDSENEALVETP